MRTTLRALRLIAGALILAIVLFLLAAAPGFLSDASSTVPVNTVVETVR
jgi:hypothetical protein